MTRTAEQANFVKTIDVRETPEKVFRALTHEMDRWWSTHVNGALDSLGAKIKVNFPPNNGHWTFKATALSQGKLVELKCIEAYHVVAGQPAEIEKEWLGTMLRWSISPNGEGTRIRFEHIGLTPALHCYEICDQGWNFFFGTSFPAYLNDGAGLPHSAKT